MPDRPVELEAALLAARNGTAFFSRKLSELPDDELRAPSLLPEWSRAHVVAHVGYNALAISRLMAWATTGTETPMYASWDVRNQEIEDGANLPPSELRSLFEQSAARLAAAWQAAPPEAWSREVRNAQGRMIPASKTVWMRTREVWIHAVDLGSGATFADLPADVLERILQEIVGSWRDRGDGQDLVLRDTGGASFRVSDGTVADPEIISGTLPDVTAWAAGRSDQGVSSSKQGQPAPAPRWI
ncbi:mycothiol-dependent maleylpyruvate isomerase [Arthrobacter crystallopoietes BAB-32]|uniref:Mycothiol-dependent maleylpyruvate isomerase n=1 Tax=Arthrobacter crystallopoietes BAB-32 TaxID=1246476 RepID=N1UWN2_9MICC|nr:maleylpyruvate isomerase family mycothiol-dependent enzyme [Arthrobacter crystallopoietes]EMY32232.1 mycothiol-dependent maleylpyruvate isomerase [Arthrobacter crystallopoietes BAB-32]